MRFLLLVFIISAVAACKPSQQLTAPMEMYDDNIAELPISLLNIPVDISLRDLDRSLNESLQGLIYEDKNINDGDKMMVKARKVQNITIETDGLALVYRVPLGLWIKYDTGLGHVEADAELVMNFRTAFSIDEGWNLQTYSQLERHEWLKSPKVRMGFVSLPVGFISDLVIRRSQGRINKAIDDMVAEQLQLRPLVEAAWQKTFEPMLVAPAYNTWLSIHPQSISMTPLEMGQYNIRSTIVVAARPGVSVGEQPRAERVQPLPKFQYALGDPGDDFNLYINTEVSFKEAERLAKANLVGQTFAQGSRAVRVEDIQLYGQGQNIVVNTRLSGSYEGSIYFMGRPVYNPRSNSIDLEDMDFSLETKNALFKSAGWLLKSTILKKVQENMDFLLDYNLREIQTQMEEQLKEYKFSEGVKLRGSLSAFQIQNAWVTKDAIRVFLGMNGKVNVLVEGL